MEYTSNTDTVLRGKPDYEIRVRYTGYFLSEKYSDNDIIVRMMAAVFSCLHIFHIVYVTSSEDENTSINDDDGELNFQYIFNCVFGIACSLPVRRMAFYMSKLIGNIAHAICNGIHYQINLYSPHTGREVAMVNDLVTFQPTNVEITTIRLAALNDCVEKWLSRLDTAEKAEIFCHLFGGSLSAINLPFGMSDKFTSDNLMKYNHDMFICVESTMTSNGTFLHGSGITVGENIRVRPQSNEFVVCTAHGKLPFDKIEKYHIFMFTETRCRCTDDSVSFSAEILPDVGTSQRLAEITGISIEDARHYVAQALKLSKY